MAEVGNLLDFGTPDEQNQAQAAIEPNTDNLLDFANNEDSAIESQSALPDLEAEPKETTTEAAEPQEQLTELVEGEEREADVCETVEEAQSPLEPAESGTEQQQDQQQDPIIELDSPNPADTSGMAEQQQQQGDEPAAIDFGSILSADGQSVANNEEVKVDVDADVDVRADASVFDNRQYEVESSGGGVEISLRPKSEHDWSTSTKSVAMQYSNSTHNSSGNATAAVSSQSRNSFNERAVPVWSAPDAEPVASASKKPQQRKLSDTPNAYFVGVGIGSPGDVCRLCQKKVYPMEQLTSDGHVYHKSCYRCHKCNRLLSVGNFGVLDNQLYCQPHYLEIFRMRGHYQASADRPAAEIVGRDNPVDDGISQVQKLSNLKSRFESSGDSSQQSRLSIGDGSSSPRRASSPAAAAPASKRFSAAPAANGGGGGGVWSREPRWSSPNVADVVVTPPGSGGHHPTPGSRNGAHSDPPADVVRSGDAVPAEGELPPPGASKSVLAMFRNLETGGQQPAKDQQQQPGRLKGRPNSNTTLDRRASVPLQKQQPQQQPSSSLQKQISAEQHQPSSAADGIVRESDSNDILPQQGIAKALLSVWRDKELQKQQTQQQEQQLLQRKRQSLASFERSPSSSSLSSAAGARRQSSYSQASGPPSPRRAEAVAPTQRRPYQPQPNMDFDYTAPVRSAAESESSPVERPPDVVRSGDPNPADELPPANFTRSALQMWKNKEVEGGKVAPNPETSERLRQRARETSGVNNNIRLPGAASVGVSGSRDSDDAERPSSPQPRDESSENEPSVPPADVARWGAGDGNDEMPKQGITQNLRSMFSGGQQ
uniref:LIM zinc-binding domain-containing protein n=1 Tax=Macrostomum lignano TaxID=282301 RepID=A0A1I8J357_9PLAT